MTRPLSADTGVVEAAHTSWRPLGRLLVERGLLTDDQLEHALDEQSITGRRLGEILVRAGFVSDAALASALAEQYGFERTSETGFGTGLRAQIQRRQAPAEADGEAPMLRLVPDPEHESDAETLAALDDVLHLPQLEEHWARLAEAEERLAGAERDAERRRAQAVRFLARLRRREAELAALPLPLPVEPEPEPEPVHGWLAFARVGDGYELVERDGTAPPPQALVALPELSPVTFVVEKVARSPLPGDRRPCAYVDVAPPLNLR